MDPIRLDRVTIPTELDRSQIVRRLDSTQLQIVEDVRWAAPLDETIRRVLSNDLAARLPQGAVANPNEPSVGEKRQSLAVDFSEFYGDSTLRGHIASGVDIEAIRLKQPAWQ